MVRASLHVTLLGMVFFLYDACTLDYGGEGGAMQLYEIDSYTLLMIYGSVSGFCAGTQLVSEVILVGEIHDDIDTGIALLYRFAPDRRRAKWRWLTPGAVLACLMWVGGSIAFSRYVQHFGNYNETFGALGGVIILLTWMWLSAFIILLGAQIDAELEAQTARDSTVGQDDPMGERGAVKADTLGPTTNEILSPKPESTPRE